MIYSLTGAIIRLLSYTLLKWICTIPAVALQADWNIVEKGWKAHVLGEAPHKFKDAKTAVTTLRVRMLVLKLQNQQRGHLQKGYIWSMLFKISTAAQEGMLHLSVTFNQKLTGPYLPHQDRFKCRQVRAERESLISGWTHL